MLDEKTIAGLKKKAESCIKEGMIDKTKESRFVGFFLENSKNSLETAKLLMNVSSSADSKQKLGMPESYSGFLWVINASYYSMFYMARALLESDGIKIKSEASVHSATLAAFIYYFFLTGKLEKKLVEDLADAEEEAFSLLGKGRASGLIEDYMREKKKRGIFTYELGAVAMQNKAETSLSRAKQFCEEIRKALAA